MQEGNKQNAIKLGGWKLTLDKLTLVGRESPPSLPSCSLGWLIPKPLVPSVLTLSLEALGHVQVLLHELQGGLLFDVDVLHIANECLHFGW